MLRDTEAEAPLSIPVNYAELRRVGDDYTLHDLASGDDLDIAPKTIVNASGAWLDDVSGDLQGGTGDRMVSGTKGSHLVLDNPKLHDALDGHMVYFENSDSRVCIVFPYLGRVLAGSTDIRVERATRVRCEPDELSYIMESLALVFDGIDISPDDVVFSYSGIRPLPRSDADFTGRASRGHFLRRVGGKVPQFCMIGGKWTTFRAFGEQTADQVLAELGVPRRASTLDKPIGGGAGYPQDQAALERDLIREFGLSAPRARHLAGHYGSDARTVQSACANSPDDAPLSPDTLYTRAEIAHLFETEYALTVADMVLRRTSLAIRGDLDGEILDRVTEIVAKGKSLTVDATLSERNALVDELVTFHGASKEKLASKCPEWRTTCT